MRTLPRRHRLGVGLIGAGLCAIALSGCSKDSPRTIAVQGTVRLNGKPLPGGVITFQPVTVAANLPHRLAQGSIGADGTYSLSTFEPGDGALPGEYVVMIRGIQPIAPVDEFSRSTSETIPLAIPAIYSDAQRTPLKATVDAGGSSQKIDLELKGQ